jgi:hypothetical protein
MTVSRVLIGPFARERAGWRLPHLALAGAAFLITSPALAAHCPRGEIWMIHARECVGRHVTHRREKVTLLRQKVTHLVPEEPSHHGLTFVHVIEPPKAPSTFERTPSSDDPNTVAARMSPEVEIPYAIPSSRMNVQTVIDFERIGK